jgi:hypothetical protein
MTAALADHAGFIVVETANGWSAIQPEVLYWDRAPGAYSYWKAEITRYPDEFGNTDVLSIECETINDAAYIASRQGNTDGSSALRSRVTVSRSHTPMKMTINRKKMQFSANNGVKSLRSATPLANGPMYLNIHVNLSSAIGSRFERNLTPANSLF